METLINPEYIGRANSASHFDAGDSIEREARNTLAKFDAEFPTDGLTDEQTRYLDERRANWREFVINHYNDHCRRRAEYMPVTVCGPARYPGQKMQKKVDRIIALSGEFAEKAGRFLDNTRKHLDNLIPLENSLRIYERENGIAARRSRPAIPTLSKNCPQCWNTWKMSRNA